MSYVQPGNVFPGRNQPDGYLPLSWVFLVAGIGRIKERKISSQVLGECRSSPSLFSLSVLRRFGQLAGFMSDCEIDASTNNEPASCTEEARDHFNG